LAGSFDRVVGVFGQIRDLTPVIAVWFSMKGPEYREW